MTEPRPAPLYLGDDFALDFLNSVAAPWGEEIDWLASGSDLLDWLEQAHDVVPADMVAHIRDSARPGALDQVAKDARDLREWFRGFVRKHAGKPLGQRALRDLAALNKLLELDEAHPQIEAALFGEGLQNRGDARLVLRWQTRRHWHGFKALLFPIAGAIGDFVCREDFTFVRSCEGPTCTLWFLDVSKGHARRWCSMALCGNRAKAGAHRARARRRHTGRPVKEIRRRSGDRE